MGASTSRPRSSIPTPTSSDYPLMNALRQRLRRDEKSQAGFTVIELMVAHVDLLNLPGNRDHLARRADPRCQPHQGCRGVGEPGTRRLRAPRPPVRYSDGINLQGAGASGDIYFEFRTPADSAPSGVTTCTQWRYDPIAQTVASRSWPDGSLSSATFGTFSSTMSRMTVGRIPVPVRSAHGQWFVTRGADGDLRHR